MVKHQPSEVRRAQLFRAAMEVLAEKGYHATRVEDIAERAGLSKGSLYHHFDSKQALFVALFEEMMEAFIDQMTEGLTSGITASAAMRQVMRQFAESFEGAPGLMRGMFDLYLLAVRDEVFRRSLVTYYERMVEAAARLIQRGMDEGEFDPALDPHEVAWIFFTSGDGLFLIHISLDMEARVVPLFMQQLEIFLRGLRARPVEPPPEQEA